MAAIGRTHENQPELINWFISLNGVLTDAYQVRFRIFDITGGVPGAQIFPATPGTYEDVTTGPGNFSVGSYYAYDNAAGAGWTPTSGTSIGTHRIEWNWKASAGSPWQAGFEDFEVLDTVTPGASDLYCSVADIRALGVPSAEYPDVDVIAAIELWQAFLERACRQWFNPRTLLLKFDGTDSDTLHFGVPIIDIEYIKINDNTTVLDTTQYRVYSSRSYPDDRRNPRIKLRSLADFPDIYTAPIAAEFLKFRKGRQNQEIKGTFGFLEDDGTTPRLIKRALCKLVVEKLNKPIYPKPGVPAVPLPPLVSGALTEEWTDGHKFKYTEGASKFKERRPTGFQGITQDQEIIDIIRMYRAPIGIATPAHPSHVDGGAITW